MSGKSRYKPKTRRYELIWPEGEELAGLEVTFRGMRMGELESLGTIWDQFKESSDDDDEEAGTTEKIALMSQMIEKLGSALVWWNRLDEDTMKWNEETEEYEETEDSKVLPANADGLRKLEQWEFMEVLNAYMTRTVGVSEDLGKDSNSGGQSLAELPMTDL